MKIIIYTISSCQFSKQEKEYLASHSLPFEEKNVESNREFLTEMLTVGNNFAGTPVTKIEKDDGKIEVLKGFTREEFDKTLGFTAPPAAEPASTQAPADKPVESVEPVVVQAPVVEPAPVAVTPTPPAPPAPEPAPVVAAPVVPANPPVQPQNDPMASVLNNLQAQAGIAEPSVEPIASPPVAAPPSPSEPPQTVVSGQPTIPDPTF